jgi:hypothetical protein
VIRGIVLMPDSSDERVSWARNRTMQMTRLLVPVLRERGYRFIRLDAIPQVESATRVSAQATLWTTGNRFLRHRPGGDEIVARRAAGRTAESASRPQDPQVSNVTVRDATGGTPEIFGLVQLGENRIALRAASGLYLSPQQGRAREVRAEGETLDSAAILEVEPPRGGQMVFRTDGGAYWTVAGGDGRVRANAFCKAEVETFSVRQLFSA